MIKEGRRPNSVTARLRMEGHPYGLLLGSIPTISLSAEQPSFRYLSGFFFLAIACFASKKSLDAIAPGEDDPGISTFGSSAASFLTYVASYSFGLGSGSNSLPPPTSSSIQTDNQYAVNILPLSVTSVSRNLIENNESLRITDRSICCGTITVNTLRHRGPEPYLLSSGQQEPIAQVKPGQSILILHVNHPGKGKELSPLARVRKIKKDFINLCRLLENPEESCLADEEIAQIRTLSDAPMIGISHLVRLLASVKSMTLPTWNIKTLPKLLQLLHRLDSQAVSKLFGGTRRVKTDDIRVVFISPAQRAAIANIP